MTALEEESKPPTQEPAAEAKPKLTIHINHEGQTITLKASKTTLFSKIFHIAEERFRVQPGAFRFSFEGERILGTQTPAEVNMEEEDMIDAHLEQVGGYFIIRCTATGIVDSVITDS